MAWQAPEPAPSDNLYLSGLPAEMGEDQLKAIFGAYGNIAQAKLMPGQGSNAALIRFATKDEAVWVKDNLNGNIPQGLTTPVNVKYANAPGAGKGKGKDDGKGGGKGWAPYDGGKSNGKGWGDGGKGWSDGGKGWGKDSGKGWGMDGGKGWGGDKGKGKGKGKGGIKGLKQMLIDASALPGGKANNDENCLFVGGLPPDTTTTDIYEIFAPFGAIPAKGCLAMMNMEDGSCKGYGFVNFVDPTALNTAVMTLNGAQMPDGTTLKVNVKQAPKAGGKGGK